MPNTPTSDLPTSPSWLDTEDFKLWEEEDLMQAILVNSSNITLNPYELPPAQMVPTKCELEPAMEPMCDDISYTDLVFWLGDDRTGSVECHCRTCAERMSMQSRHRRRCMTKYRYSPYQRVSSKVPPINFNLPRIEGVN